MKPCSKASGFFLRLFLLKSIPYIIIICLFLFTDCASPSKQDTTSQFSTDMRWTVPDWIELAPPINYYRHQNTDTERPLVYHIVRVQLADPSISIGATRPIEADSYKTLGKCTKDYVKQSGAFVGINASPFTYPAGIFSAKRDIVGLYVYEGTIVSRANAKYAALCFDKDKRAFIVNSQTQESADAAWFSFGGFWTILEQGIIYPFENIQESRTAVGISEGGFTLYLLAVEKSKKSTGLSFMDCAQILQQAGAKVAMQLDGGGSASLVFHDFPQHSLLSSRKVANNLGIFYNPKI